MKTIDLHNEAFKQKPPEVTHTKEELEQLHACIRYNQLFMRGELTEHTEQLTEQIGPLDLPLRNKARKAALNKLGIGRF